MRPQNWFKFIGWEDECADIKFEGDFSSLMWRVRAVDCFTFNFVWLEFYDIFMLFLPENCTILIADGLKLHEETFKSQYQKCFKL